MTAPHHDHESEEAAAGTGARGAGAEAEELHHARGVAAPEGRTPVSAEPGTAGGDAGRDLGREQRRPQRERRLPIRQTTAAPDRFPDPLYRETHRRSRSG